MAAIATPQHSLSLFLGGRFLLGLGVESLGVAQSSLTCQWFSSSRRLGLALSLNVAMARLGAIVNDMASPWLWREWEEPSRGWMQRLLQWLTAHGVPEHELSGVVIAATIGTLLCGGGLLVVLLVVLVDYGAERRSMRNAAISLVITAEESQHHVRASGAPVHATDEQSLLLSQHRSTIYGTPGWNGSASSLNVPSASSIAQQTLQPHIPFSSVRRQVSARDVRSLRHSYFRTDRQRRASGLYRRYSRPPLAGSRPRQRGSVDSVWVAPLPGHGTSTPPTSPLSHDGLYRQRSHSDAEHERLVASADNILPYSLAEGSRSNSHTAASTRRHRPGPWAESPKKRTSSRSYGHEAASHGRQQQQQQHPGHSRDISVGTIGTVASTSSAAMPCGYTANRNAAMADDRVFSFYSAIIPMVNVASDYLLTRWTSNPIHAGLLMALPDLISTLLVPLGAENCYHRSRHSRILLWVGVVMMLAHWYLGAGNPGQWHGVGAMAALGGLGLCYGVFSVVGADAAGLCVSGAATYRCFVDVGILVGAAPSAAQCAPASARLCPHDGTAQSIAGHRAICRGPDDQRGSVVQADKPAVCRDLPARHAHRRPALWRGRVGQPRCRARRSASV
ncbi:hypothetical protein SYNPS1DRAFT_30694 [Syncephalis pseudoplumigaleata]|uniref:Major facilitator superfamily domain-containing protein n=1 Tax=Syncephalis pseudoplumigaleata TaxID=1712513 RepID=A0A4P9YWA2_9FUNG|nr:hypothetical protein SYNPS1DRAFT_30694 [Syncephalis pseudoplumigaleata]|eukprot:RKP23551.1 hypothetical protein SYNPS1DRAFT_30694 [Syncephalis pseudoplumigaleata]